MVQERIATYEALSEMRSNTLPELLVIERFLDTLPERCSHIFSKKKLVDICIGGIDKHKPGLALQKSCKFS